MTNQEALEESIHQIGKLIDNRTNELNEWHENQWHDNLLKRNVKPIDTLDKGQMYGELKAYKKALSILLKYKPFKTLTAYYEEQ
nr:hypothetical protein [uncultured Mediterranean phage uvMED]